MSIKKIPLFKTDTLNFLSADDPDLTAITALSVSTVTTTGTEVTVDGEELLIMKESDILGIIA